MKLNAFPLIFILALTGCKGKLNKPSLMVFAGSISKPFLDTAAEIYVSTHRVRVNLEYGGSGSVLSKAQISSRGDIYVAGSPEFMEIALARGLVERGTITRIAWVRPALVYKKSLKRHINSVKSALYSDLNVGIADPDTVCLGRLAVEVLKKEGIEEKLNDVRIRASSCTSLLRTLVEGSSDVVIGYDVFGKMFPEKLTYTPLKGYQPVAIMAAVFKKAPRKKLAQNFLNFLASEKVKKIAAQKGFLINNKENH